MSCEIIQFSTAARPARHVSDNQTPAGVTAIGNRVLTPRQRRREGKPELPPPATETAKNARIRTERRDAWRLACRVSEYWRTRLDWHSALRTAQQYGIADSASFPSAENEGRFGLVDTWREAVVKQLLTPAPDGARSHGSAPRSSRTNLSGCRSRWRAPNRPSRTIWHFSPLIRRAGPTAKRWSVGASSKKRCASASGT